MLKRFKNLAPERSKFWMYIYPDNDPYWDADGPTKTEQQYAHLNSLFQGAFKVVLYSQATFYEILLKLDTDTKNEFSSRLLYFDAKTWRLERNGWTKMKDEGTAFSELKYMSFEQMKEHIQTHLLANMTNIENVYIRNFNNIGCEAFVRTSGTDFVLTYFNDDVWKMETMAAYAMSTDRNLSAFGRG